MGPAPLELEMKRCQSKTCQLRVSADSLPAITPGGSGCERPYLRMLNGGNTRKRLQKVAGRSMYHSTPARAVLDGLAFDRKRESVPSDTKYRFRATEGNAV